MKNKISIFLVLFIWISIIFLNSCVSEYNAILPANEEDVFIVEGNIIANSEVIFYLSKSFALSIRSIPEETFRIEANLTIVGSDGSQSEPATSLGNGKYQIAVGELKDDISYGIQIEYNGELYKSELSKPLYTPEIDSISWEQKIVREKVTIQISTHGNDSLSKYYLWSYKEDWQITSDFETTVFMNPYKASYFGISPSPYRYCWAKTEKNKLYTGTTEALVENRIVNKIIYSLSPSDIRLSDLYCTTFTQQSISKSAYDYYQNKVILNEEMGGLFTPQPSEISGNISCQTNPSKRVMGYVSVSKNISSKRIFIKRQEITVPIPKDPCNYIPRDEVPKVMEELNIGSIIEFYSYGFRPVDDIYKAEFDNPNWRPGGWAWGACVDCRMNGGTKNKPDFWPNDLK